MSMTDTFSPHYELGPEIGRGAYSVVHAGKKKMNGEKVAIKVFLRSKLSPKDMEQIQGEIKILKVLDHPHVLKMHDFCMDSKHFYIVTEFLEGGELFDSIVEREKYDESDAQHVLKSLASALAYCHSKNVVHRDLKPENILLTSKDPHNLNIKLADFGFAKEMDDEMLKTALGTPGYIAPEILNRKRYDSSVDIWAFGIVAYILLCGYPPFYDENQAALFAKIKAGKYEFEEQYWEKISSSAKELISGCLVVDPAKRFTIEQILAHPWMSADLPKKDITPAIEMLRSQILKRRFRAGVRGIVALEKMKKLVAMASESGISSVDKAVV
jgi:calcium/calmodulin-dependent protein kinase I